MPSDLAYDSPKQAVVAGHICLDIIPSITTVPVNGSQIVTPGAVLNVGPARLSTGGAVANTGLALHRLGISTRLLGKVGNDLFGEEILRLLQTHGSELSKGMIIASGEATSYSLVISPPGIDRSFLHCPGTNDSFCNDDIPDSALKDAAIFHFGYPPQMRHMYCDGGNELETIFRRARAHGLVTSLDMARPDPASEAGRVNWRALLHRVAPSLDIFLPSIDELLFMLEGHADTSAVDGALLDHLSSILLSAGVPIVVIKLAEQGLYLRTAGEGTAIISICTRLGLNPRDWTGRELLSPCFAVEVAGTTGAGDCTIAGFLAGLLRGNNPAGTITNATAVGATSVEASDATSGVPCWDDVEKRLASGWARRPVSLPLAGWIAGDNGVLVGPNDVRNS